MLVCKVLGSRDMSLCAYKFIRNESMTFFKTNLFFNSSSFVAVFFLFFFLSLSFYLVCLRRWLCRRSGRRAKFDIA